MKTKGWGGGGKFGFEHGGKNSNQEYSVGEMKPVYSNITFHFNWILNFPYPYPYPLPPTLYPYPYPYPYPVPLPCTPTPYPYPYPYPIPLPCTPTPYPYPYPYPVPLPLPLPTERFFHNTCLANSFLSS